MNCSRRSGNDLKVRKRYQGTVISISRNGLLKSCARFVIERSEIRKKQHDFKSVHFECRMVLFDLAKLVFASLNSRSVGTRRRRRRISVSSIRLKHGEIVRSSI